MGYSTRCLHFVADLLACHLSIDMNKPPVQFPQPPYTLPPNQVGLIYLLYAIGFVFGITFLAGGIMALIKRGEESDALLASHYAYQARTFIWSMVWLVVGFITFIAVVGYFVLIANYIWTLYRVIKGWLAFSSFKPVG